MYSRGPMMNSIENRLTDSLVQIPLDRLRPNPDQPREHFDPDRLEELARSLQQHGVLAPLVAYEDNKGQYILVAGERRLRASALAGLRTVPVLLRSSPPTDTERLELALIENLQRHELHPLEVAAGYQKLIQEHGMGQEQVAMRMGLDRATVANSLRLLKLPKPGQDALREGKITPGHARALLMIEEPERFMEVLQKTLEKGLSVRATEQLARLNRKPEKKATKSRSMDRGLQRLCDQLSRVVASRVVIQPRRDGGGKVTIAYESDEDLERVVAILKGA